MKNIGNTMALAQLLFRSVPWNDNEGRAKLEEKLVWVARDMGCSENEIVDALMSNDDLVFYAP